MKTISALGVVFCFLSCVSSLHAEGTNGFRIASYNVENYITMPRRIDGKLRAKAGKPESERDAVVRMVGSIRPDVLGLQEMGESGQFSDLQRRLRKSGLDFPYSEYLQAADTSRHVALLSRIPIVEHHSQNDLPLRVNGVTLHSPRGILDVTVEPVSGERIRILCVHLKAKLEVAEYDQADLRLAESQYLRRYVRDILRTDPSARLVLMGDFNDTKNEKEIWQITGKPEWPDSLTALPLADDRGEFWTEFWSYAHVYSRIDYIMVSKKLEGEVDSGQSGIARPSFWSEASDHCPVYLTLRKPRTTSPSITAPTIP
ncbi:MAG: endonuclease/exonuclease/phosphatase family protein [Verrucomicrobiota bacterium]